MFQFAIEHPPKFLLLPEHYIRYYTYTVKILEPKIEMNVRGAPQLFAHPETYENTRGWGNSVIVETHSIMVLLLPL